MRIYRSPFPDIEVPDVTLTEYVLRGARDRGDKIAFLDATTGERVTFREIADEVDAAAGSLAGLGVGPGQVVGLVSHNQPRYAVALHAALATGAAVTPMNPMLTVDELAKQLTAAGASVIISSEPAATKAAEAADLAGITGIERRIVIGTAEGFTPLADLTSSGAPAPQVRMDPRTAIAALPFSSGTTGQSKGVMLTHRNLVANVAQNLVGWQVDEDDVLAGILPFFHAYAFVLILNTGLLTGATTVTLPRYGLEAYLQMVQDHRVTRAFLAPPMVLQLATAPEVERYDLSSLEFGICGAAPLDVEVTERAEKRLGCLIRQGYGLTEAGPGVNQTADTAFTTTPAGSIGRLLAGTEARLVDPTSGEDCAPGEPGELWVRGPQVMAGYLDNPEATAGAVVDGGWLRTGDIMRIDSDGVMWVVDRLKELIKYKGYQVAPAELESLLLTHPDVLDVAVVGVPHPEAGEAPKAYVVTRESVDAEALMAWVAGRVAPYKKVRSIEFVPEIPKSPSGKILRRLLKQTG
jgi:acyl-CoA synthetase (AMP-forming)/AMP-acid ligase II